MNDSNPRFVILAAVDFTDSAERVIRSAAWLAQATKNSELHVVHVSRANVQTDGERMSPIGPMVRRTFQGPLVCHLTLGTPWRAIVQTATTLEADLIVVGTRDLVGIERLADGSVSQRVAKHAGCPVMLVRPKAHHGDRSIEIDPPCAECVEAQRASSGKQFYCTRHATHHAAAHVFYEFPESFAVGSSLIRPE